MRLTLFTNCALRTLIFLARRRPHRSTVAEIAAHYGISRCHLSKVVYSLTKLGVIGSVRGRGGGIVLALPPQEIRVGAVVRASEPGFVMAGCFEEHAAGCRRSGDCRLQGALAQALDAYLAALDRVTLAELADG
ncbi:RrF2 family transcriptional regulator [Duganella radicis]|uniref:Rrf2 family transcriptional regulator n=1 Tax=Duganella radicis TaxID=551988 RepID=A0A6L6PFT0_9BURK|nr:Rrf2 family transcriptional regulator [Duganella radicis]MTV37843.1 Rrf2 family transcriptional regulator [Duganella radicis]